MEVRRTSIFLRLAFECFVINLHPFLNHDVSIIDYDCILHYPGNRDVVPIIQISVVKCSLNEDVIIKFGIMRNKCKQAWNKQRCKCSLPDCFKDIYNSNESIFLYNTSISDLNSITKLS